jgi:hypothetical protein
MNIILKSNYNCVNHFEPNWKSKFIINIFIFCVKLKSNLKIKLSKIKHDKWPQIRSDKNKISNIVYIYTIYMHDFELY